MNNTSPLTMDRETAEKLFTAVEGRLRPEDVAKIVVERFPSPPHRAMWQKRANGRASSYMFTKFHEAAPLTKSANVLAMLLERAPLTDAESMGEAMKDLLASARWALRAPEHGELDFRGGRLDRAARRKAGVGVRQGAPMSRRRYNKVFRLTAFLEREFEHGQFYARVCDLLKGAKTGIARHIWPADFNEDAQTAMFAAYMCSRMGMRSQFTISPQTRAFDDLAEAMLNALFASPTTKWFVVAQAFPRQDVIARLDQREQLELLGHALQQMQDAACVLRDVQRRDGIDLTKGCVVQRGQDSSTWNGAAGAWNKARDFWMGLSVQLGLDVSSMMPGKAPRLMAADVAAWHRSAGNPPHPDELVVAALPMGWDVILGDAECTEAMVRAACAELGVDPEASGWARAARPHRGRGLDPHARARPRRDDRRPLPRERHAPTGLVRGPREARARQLRGQGGRGGDPRREPRAH